MTASKFGELTRITSRRNIEKLCQSIVSTKQIRSNAIRHGQRFEKKALNKFELEKGIKTHKAGLFVCVDKPFLGATPDAIVDQTTIVEVKCPYSGRSEMILPGKLFPYLSYDANGQISLKTDSKYFSQVQGQLYISKKRYCYFVVYTFCDFFCQKIEIDSEYCEISLIPKLELFYVKYLRPYIASHL